MPEPRNYRDDYEASHAADKAVFRAGVMAIDTKTEMGRWYLEKWFRVYDATLRSLRDQSI